MRVTFDPTADAAYIYLSESSSAEFGYSYNCDPVEAKAMINLDFDRDGRLIGIEVLGAQAHLPADVIARAERLGST